MSKKQSDENIMLKQKLIHYQSEISKYKQRLKRYERSDHSNQYGQNNDEKELLESQIAELKQKVNTLEQQVEELKTENMILRNNRTKNQEIKFSQDGKKQTLDSWFVNNLENQNAIKRPNRTVKNDWDHD